MRRTTVIVLMMMTAVPNAAFALKAGDTMSDWAKASDQERSAALDEMMEKFGTHGAVSRSVVLDCLNRAAEVGGHGGLPLEEIARACAEPPSGSVGGGSDGTGI